ncbi:MAG: bifunctional adenosylcobinamide kinase/adenosylcobinamide-phosphate guanyltransferase [Nitrospira sp.]|nr:MAG: bifunctional adenosylcobinamide kinase/adenosylcobinamide-phosphate guanyltransferase [Nitrospira sp.]
MSTAKPSKRKGTSQAASRIIFVLGGAASGKSDVALRLAGATTPKAFVATGQGLDDEMTARIARHQAMRPSAWETVELRLELAPWFSRCGHRYRTIVMDCVTLWLSNLHGSRVTESAIVRRVSALLKAMRATAARVVIVSNELGLGLVPSAPSVRAFRDVAGRVNQQIAAEADEVHLVVSGIPFQLK